MSTNYYAVTPQTPNGEEGLHIGKQSAGWDFLFRAHPDLGLTDCDAWRKYLSRPEVKIVAESGYVVLADEFMARATIRPAEAKGQWMRAHVRDVSHDEHGHPFAYYEFC